jgi:RNA polymerase sigma-70 factor (ECF subfamily)
MAPQTSLTLLDRLKNPTNLQDWELFVALYQPLITGQLVRYNVEQHDAEDLCQEVLVVTFRALPDFEHNGRVGAFRNWLRNIIRHRALTFVRSRGRLPIPVSSIDHGFDPLSAALEPDPQWDEEHDQHVLSRALVLIEPNFTRSTWLAFRAQALDGHSPQQTADMLGLSVNAVMIAKSRVLAQLRELCSGLIDDGHL